MPSPIILESRIHDLAKHHGLSVFKSRRWRSQPFPSRNRFMLYGGKRNLCLLGRSFDATLQHIVTYLLSYAS